MNIEKTDLIIQARVGSSRLPGKSLLDLAGETLVGRILERVKRCRLVDEIILAIPDNEENLPLKLIGEKFNVKVFLGSEDDLLDRYFKAAKSSNSKYICRLPADNPTPEPIEIDKLIKFHKENNKYGFSSNICSFFQSGYPDGIGIEIFNIELLENVYHYQLDSSKREHVHLNFFDYNTEKAVDNKWCPIKTIECPISIRRPELILDVNTYDQYLFMKELYEYLYPLDNNFTIKDTLNWYDNVYKK